MKVSHQSAQSEPPESGVQENKFTFILPFSKTLP